MTSILLFVISLWSFEMIFFVFFIVLLFVLVILIRMNRSKTAKLKFFDSKIKSLQKELALNKTSLETAVLDKTKELTLEIENRKSIETDRKIALIKAEEANFLKNAFLANMSHEIRTPLNGIIGFSNLLLSEDLVKEKQDLHDFSEGILESGQRLMHLLEHIIDLSRIDANDYILKLSDFNLNTVLTYCIEKIKEDATAKNLQLDYNQNKEHHVFGDSAALEKSIDLILNNAVKYSQEGMISIRCSENLADHTLQLFIQDTGIGIDPSFLPNIFEAFRQESTGYSKMHQGAGLGLPLARKLIEMMHGSLEITSTKGVGTKVLISLHLSEEKKIECSVSTTSQTSLKESPNKILPTVFIVEDDKMNRMVFNKMLAGYANIVMAVDGDHAISLLNSLLQEKGKPNVILLDINLPAPWDGMLLLTEFKKKWPELERIPFIAQTAYAMSGDKELFLAKGFDDYISKPIDKKQLLAKIENNMRIFKN